MKLNILNWKHQTIEIEVEATDLMSEVETKFKVAEKTPEEDI